MFPLMAKIGANTPNERAKKQNALPAAIPYLHIVAVLVNLTNSSTACVCALLLHNNRGGDCH